MQGKLFKQALTVLRTDLFDFDLPTELIAQEPVRPRERAKLLHLSDRLADLHIADLPQRVAPGDLVVLNNTRVLPTRFLAKRDQTQIEITLVQAHDENSWWAFAKPGRKVRTGDRLILASGLIATAQDKHEDGRILLAFKIGGIDLIDRIKRQGHMPLPPYIKRPKGGDESDNERYQSAFAKFDGSVAAPTASLHLDRNMLGRLTDAGAKVGFLTLHVGMGTFLPVKSDDTSGHVMHSEWYDVPEETVQAIERTRAQGGRVLAVGTTVLRTLEAAGVSGRLQAGTGSTDLFIVPGYRFNMVDRLLTNFHLPRSTLFMLVSAFCGLERMQAAYAHAIANQYRFFSYGDACLLERA